MEFLFLLFFHFSDFENYNVLCMSGDSQYSSLTPLVYSQVIFDYLFHYLCFLLDIEVRIDFMSKQLHTHFVYMTRLKLPLNY